MTPPGDGFRYTDGPYYAKFIATQKARGFPEIAEQAAEAIKSASRINSRRLWCKNFPTGATLRGFSLAFQVKGLLSVPFELLYTESNDKRNLIAIKEDAFSSQELEKFRADFGGGKC